MISPDPPDRGARLAPLWRLSDVILITAVVVLIIGAGTLALLPFLGDDVDPAALTVEPSLGLSLALLVVNIVGFALPVALVARWRRLDWAAQGWRRMDAGWWLQALMLGLAAIFITNLVAMAVLWLLDRPFDNPQIEFVIPEGFSFGGLLAMTLLAGVLVPIAEEWLFRGVLFRWLRQISGFWPAALISSALFGLFHGLPALVAGAAVLGFMSAWAYERSGSLWSAVIIHAVNNGVKVLLLYLAQVAGWLPPV